MKCLQNPVCWLAIANNCGQWPIGTLDFVNISSAKKPWATVIHLLVIKTLVESSTHAVLILQNYVGVIEKRVPPLLSMILFTPQDKRQAIRLRVATLIFMSNLVASTMRYRSRHAALDPSVHALPQVSCETSLTTFKERSSMTPRVCGYLFVFHEWFVERFTSLLSQVLPVILRYFLYNSTQHNISLHDDTAMPQTWNKRQPPTK